MKNIPMTLIFLCLSATTLADEGMWTLDNFPAAAVQEKYGVNITDEWLDTVRRSVARLDSGCSASFVSPEGMVLTNHHCAMRCISQNSSADNDLEANGFLAANRDEEIACPTDRLSVLIDTVDITDKVAAATDGMDELEAAAARRKTLARLVEECEATSELKCEDVTLYRGGQYWLYRYERYEDVRLVFAPETDIAAFGGDPDNFNFPRWCLDMAILRVYEDGKPLATPYHLDWRQEGLSPGDAMFVAGRPGSTQRLLTVDDLKFLRDVSFPAWLRRVAELRGRYIQYATSSDEAFRITRAPLQSIENGIKVVSRRLDALHDDDMLAHKLAVEADLKKRIASDPTLAAMVGSAWDDIANANEDYLAFREDYLFIEAGAAFSSDLFGMAKRIVRVVTERDKANEDRLRGYTDAEMPRLRQLTLADRPIYPELEILKLSWSLDKMREYLGPDSLFVHQILGKDTPETVARRLIEGTELFDPATREALWNADRKKLEASDDPMMRLALAIDADARILRQRYEDDLESVTDKAYEKIAAARFKIYGTDEYPDATFTLRVTYGTHTGWQEKGADVRPATTLGEIYPRVTGSEPFRLPASWSGASDSLPDETKFNFVGTTDIIGGNSGSPVIDKDGQLVGLVFDGNIHSIGGAYWFNNALNRTVAVHPDIMLRALGAIYGADHIVDELTMVH